MHVDKCETVEEELFVIKILLYMVNNNIHVWLLIKKPSVETFMTVLHKACKQCELCNVHDFKTLFELMLTIISLFTGCCLVDIYPLSICWYINQSCLWECARASVCVWVCVLIVLLEDIYDFTCAQFNISYCDLDKSVYNNKILNKFTTNETTLILFSFTLPSIS